MDMYHVVTPGGRKDNSVLDFMRLKQGHHRELQPHCGGNAGHFYSEQNIKDPCIKTSRRGKK